MVAYLLLGLAQVAGLLLTPFGAPGIWLQLGALGLFAWWSEFEPVGSIPLLVLVAIVLTAELAEAPLAGGRIERSLRRRAGGVGLAGAVAGAIAGVPFPLVGSLFGALLGALVGATIGGLSAPRPPRRGWATLGGQVLAMALRAAAGVGVALFALYATLG